MAIANIPVNELPAFGRRLMELAQGKMIGTPLLLAESLYTECGDLVEPAKRKNKHGKVVKDRAHDIEAIKRTVQTHFNEEHAYNVQTKYLFAYSRLFNCSLDYLCGKTDIKSVDMEVHEICRKLHIKESVVQNLIDGYDEDPEVFSTTRWWSDMLADEVFSDIPYAWLQYSMQVLIFQDLDKKIKAIKAAEKQADDDIYRTTMEVRRISLEKMQPGKESDCIGAFHMLNRIVSEYMDKATEKWIESKHTDLEERYYDNEIRKIEILEKALAEGAGPVKNK